MQVIYLIRHGETDYNRDGRVQGATESALSDLGQEQARRLANRMADVEVTALYSSPLRRALDTSRLAFDGRIEATLRDGLREINLGEWEGRTAESLRKEFPEAVKRWFRTPSDVTIPGAESIGDFRGRVSAEMDRIRGQHESGNVVVVAHGGVICTYLTHLLEMGLDDIWRFKIRNGSVTRILFPQGRPRIDLLGDIHHLDGAIRQPPEAPYRIFP